MDEEENLVASHSTDNYRNEHYPVYHHGKLVLEGDGPNKRFFTKIDQNTLKEETGGAVFTLTRV